MKNTSHNKKFRSTSPESSTDFNEGLSWTFLSNHTHVLVCLRKDKELRVRDLAQKIGITDRAVQNILKDLEGARVIKRERVGRRNRYQILGGARLRHPIESHCQIGKLLDWILSQ